MKRELRDWNVPRDLVLDRTMKINNPCAGIVVYSCFLFYLSFTFWSPYVSVRFHL